MDSGKENTEPATKMGLARMFHEGNKAIGTHKTNDLFKQLESRSLTEQEEAIITQRLELQRKMLLAYEAREKTRKVQYLQQLCPDLTEEEAQRALDLCHGREEAAAEQVVSDPAFKRRLQIATTSASTHPAANASTVKRTNKWHAKPSSRRPKQVDTASLGNSVFVGSFRGGKRGGSRTAHLKAAPAQPCSSQHHTNTREHPDNEAHAPCHDPADVSSHAEPPAHYSSGDWAGDSDAVISESEGEEAAQDADQLVSHHEQTGQADDEELKFEVDVIGTLDGLPQPVASRVDVQALVQESTDSAQDLHKQAGLVSTAVPNTAETASPGKSRTRQSQRLATLAEAHGKADSQTVQPSSTAATVSVNSAHGVLPDSQQGADAVPQQKVSTRQNKLQRCPGQLSQATLEASANTLRTLTVPRAVMFLQSMQPNAREGTWSLLQAMDSAKAAQLEAALSNANATNKQPEAPLTTATALDSHTESAFAESAVGQSHAQSAAASTGAPVLSAESADRLRLSKHAPLQAAAEQHLSRLSANGSSEKGTVSTLQHQADQKQVSSMSHKSGTNAGQPRSVADTQHSVSPAGCRVPLSKGRADSTAGKGPVADDIAEGDESSKASAGAPKRAWKSRNAGNKSQQVTLDKAFAKQAQKATKEQQQHAGDCGAEQRQRRSTRTKAVPAHVLESAALVSDSETEEQTESDTEFMAGTKKRGKAGVQSGSPAKKRKIGSAAKSSAEPASPSRNSQDKGKSRTSGTQSSKRKRQPVQIEADVSPKSPRADPKSPVAVRRSPRAVKKTARAVASEAMLSEELEPVLAPNAKGQAGQGRKARGPSGGNSAIARSGHTNRGRVKQKSHKAAHILEVGNVRAEKGWFNSGYIFPEGFKSQLPFRSSVDIDQLCLHECTIIGRGGDFWPQPTYKVVAMDRPDEPLVGKSCTSCWTQVLKRINSEIQARRQAGENLPPPPKTAIAGPEYFGLNQPELAEQIEALDPEQRCSDYWLGKADREAAAAGLPPVERAPRNAPKFPTGPCGLPKAKRNKRNRPGSGDEAEEAAEEEEGDESSYMTNRWSAVSRTERYRKRCGDEGAAVVDETNPMPDYIDPVTFEPVVTPAISPWGHVMGLATWKAVLAEQGKCPFTKNNLSWEQCTTLSLSNIDRYRDRIKSLQN